MSFSILRAKAPRDALVALAVFAVSAALGAAYVATFDGQAYFAQHMFGPAAMWACGRGFENVMLSRAPALEDFLYSRRDCIECGEIPGDVPVAPWDGSALSADEWLAYHPHPGWGGWLNCQRFHLYLLGSAALLWRVLGVAWSSLLPLYGFLAGMTGGAAFGLFRLMMRRWPAALFAVLFVLAPLHIQQLPDLRDYAKAPFFLAAIFLMGCLIKGSKSTSPALGNSTDEIASSPTESRRLLAMTNGGRFAGICAACGLLLGIGIGFRQDLLICIPPFTLAALVFAPGNPLREKRKRLAGLAIFTACFLVAGGPILRVLFFEANNSSHDTLIGFNKYCSDRLGVAAPVYDFGDPFLDEYTRAVVESYNARINGGRERLSHYTPEYDRASSQYFRALVVTFPADLVTRACASVLRIVDELRPDPRAPWPRDVDSAPARLFYRAYGGLTRALLAYGRYAVLLALLLLAARDLRLGLGALFLLGWFAGYPSLRFSVRHCFHMQIVSFLAAGFLVQRGLDLAEMLRVWAKSGQKPPRPDWRRYARNGAVFTAIAVTSALLPLWGLRAYQEMRVWELLRKVSTVPLEPLEVRRHKPAGGRVLLEPVGFPAVNPDGPSTQAEYLVVELDNPAEPVQLMFVYESNDPEWDFTRTVSVRPSPTADGRRTRVYFPVYVSRKSGVKQAFSGVAVDEAQAGSVLYVYRAQGFEQIPVLLTAVLYPDWQAMPLHFELTR